MAVPFDLVRQFDALRQSQGGPTQLGSYEPPQIGPRQDNGAAPPTAAPQRSAVRGGAAAPLGALAPYGGYQFSADVVPEVDRYAKSYGLRPTSGYRDPEHNREVNGSPTSDHLRGKAGDFVGPAKTMYQALTAARRDPRVKQALVHNAGSGLHLHIAWR